jgi:hypothetical protein
MLNKPAFFSNKYVSMHLTCSSLRCFHVLGMHLTFRTVACTVHLTISIEREHTAAGNSAIIHRHFQNENDAYI